jgi:hypothetical protein
MPKLTRTPVFQKQKSFHFSRAHLNKVNCCICDEKCWAQAISREASSLKL